MRALIADTTWTTASVAHTLGTAGFLVSRVDTGADLVHMAADLRPDLIVADLDMPDMVAPDALWRLMDASPKSPIAFVGRRPDAAARVHLLSQGADAVIDGRAPAPEVAARLTAIARRGAGLAWSHVALGDTLLDISGRELRIGTKTVRLSPQEYEMTEFLALRKDRLVSKDALLTHLYAFEREPGPRIVDVFLCKIRTKLAEAGARALQIDTVWGEGYRLTAAAFADELAERRKESARARLCRRKATGVLAPRHYPERRAIAGAA